MRSHCSDSDAEWWMVKARMEAVEAARVRGRGGTLKVEQAELPRRLQVGCEREESRLTPAGMTEPPLTESKRAKDCGGMTGKGARNMNGVTISLKCLDIHEKRWDVG